MRNRHFIYILFVFISLLSNIGCADKKNSNQLFLKEYDLNKPSKLILNDQLLEISGISFYPKDSSVFAISNEKGYLFKIHLTKNFLVEKWKFDKTHDFEDIYFLDSTFYVLESNGNIHTINFSEKGDTIFTKKNVFPLKKNKNEFETLYYDQFRKAFILLCKDCQGDKKSFLTAWGYDPLTGIYTPSIFTINVDAIAKKTGKDEIKFKPSAATINPKTGDLWILSAVNQLLVVTDRDGILKDAFYLNPGKFTQPEGISFTPWGDLLISNEAGNKYNVATLFIFKPKKII